MQAAQEQRANKGVVTTAVRGPTRPKSSSINTSSIFAEMFKGAIDEVERNHATQVREGHNHSHTYYLYLLFAEQYGELFVRCTSAVRLYTNVQ
jgi:hypothetical protein